jgi:hypothetical protein
VVAGEEAEETDAVEALSSSLAAEKEEDGEE